MRAQADISSSAAPRIASVPAGDAAAAPLIRIVRAAAGAVSRGKCRIGEP
ncbi:MAG: hypothetical protein NTZ11_00925 [Gammaproteobacteria bacterium]|nr:hypothetical protein [Gammaproteobacteria bacterium]